MPVPSRGNVAFPPTDYAYQLVSDGTYVSGYDATGSLVAESDDGAAVLKVCLPPANTAGWSIVFRNDGNVFPWASVPALPKGITRKLLIDLGGATVQLSANGPRFLDFGRTADHDTFQNIEIRNGVIDCNSIDAAVHTVLGTRTGGTTPDQRVNMQNITVRRIRAINMPSTATARSGYAFNTRQLAGGEGTQNYVKDILLEDCSLDGGISGFMACGGNAGAITNLNIIFDNIRFIRCTHTEPSAAPKPVNGACFQIGQNGPVGKVLLRDCYGEFSADVGIEIDNANQAVVENCTMSNCKYPFYVTNFATPPNGGVNNQEVTFRKCYAPVTNASVATGNSAFKADVNNALAFGTLVIDGCRMFQNNNGLTTGTTGTTSPQFFSLFSALTIHRIVIKDCLYEQDSIAYNNAANATFAAIWATAGTVGRLDVQDFDCKVVGSVAGGGLVSFSSVTLGVGMPVYIDGVTHDNGLTANVVGAAAVFFQNAATWSGAVKRLRVVSQGGDTTGRGIRFSSSSAVISPAPFIITDCDFSGIGGTGGTAEIVLAAAMSTVLSIGNRWKTKPVPVGLTGLVTATGKALGAQSASVFWPAMVTFAQGSGAAITAIDYSTDGGTTYTNFLTQASAALPGGFDQALGPLTADALIKVTFTTTQPTITLVPANP